MTLTMLWSYYLQFTQVDSLLGGQDEVYVLMFEAEKAWNDCRNVLNFRNVDPLSGLKVAQDMLKHVCKAVWRKKEP